VDEAFGPAALAIYTGDLATLGQMLAADPGLATRESSVSHPTLLQLVACEEPNIADPVGAARLLVEAGAQTWFPVVSAAGCNARAVLEFLLDSGAGFDREGAWTPLDEALYWSNRDIARQLVDAGAQVRSLRAAAGLGETETVETFFVNGSLRAGAGAGPVRSPFPNTVPDDVANDDQAIIDNAFVMAVNNGHLATARQLLARGAGVNHKPPGYHWHGTALHAAAWRGDRVLVEWLLSVGADPAIRDGLAHSDAAGWASHHGHPELAEQLRTST
jgi:hypothetical protein